MFSYQRPRLHGQICVLVSKQKKRNSKHEKEILFLVSKIQIGFSLSGCSAPDATLESTQGAFHFRRKFQFSSKIGASWNVFSFLFFIFSPFLMTMFCKLWGYGETTILLIVCLNFKLYIYVYAVYIYWISLSNHCIVARPMRPKDMKAVVKQEGPFTSS